jgi:3-dehydroquinate dehydratase
MRLMILNGPNLNLLGVREPHIYGSTTLAAIQASCEEFASFAGVQLSFHQSNHEGVLVDLIQAARQDADALVINPAGYRSHPSPCSMRSRLSKGRSSRCTSPTSTPATSFIGIQSSRPPSRP